MYSSTTTTQASSRQGGYGKGYAPQVPKGFTVRVFKGPSVYSFPQTTPAHFDRGYQSIPLTESRQSTSNQIWYPRAQTTTTAPSEPQKTSRPPTSSGTSLSNDTRLLTYDPNSCTKPPSYSIYQSINDTFVYEASLSSKADLSSNSEDDGTTTGEYTPSSAFSPAMSTDSITTLRGANTPNASLTDLRISTPTPAPASSSSRISFPLHIPGLAQAQTAIKGIFRGQTQNDSQSVANTSFTSRVANTGPSTSSARPPVAPPTRVSDDNVRLSELRSSITEDEDIEVDPIAKANAKYNAAASRAGSSSYYSSVRDSMYLLAANSAASSAGVRDATGQLPNLPLRSSPEQYHAQATTAHVEPSYRGAPEMTRPQSVANDHSTRLPPVEQPASTAQIPLSQNSGPSSRYVPASRTMTSGTLGASPEPKTNRDRHEQNGSTSVPSSAVRERTTSVSHVSPTITASQGPVPREGGGAGTSRSVSSADESRRDFVERQASYAPYRAEVPATQEPSTLRTAPHQVYNAPSTHYATATIQSNRDAAPNANTRYMASTATRSSVSAISHTSSHRTSPEQSYMYPPQQSVPQSRTYTSASSSGVTNYVSSASTRGTNASPPRTRRDLLAASTHGLPTRSSNAETNTVLASAQGRSQQDRRTNPTLRQSSIYGAQNPQFDDARNPRGREYDSRLETERAVAESYSRTSERQAVPVSDTHSQRGFAANLTTSSSARGHHETPTHTVAVPDRSQTPFPAPLREPQRRYSDSDSSVASHSTYGPAYASHSGASVPLPGISIVPEAPRTTEPQPQRRYSDGESNVADRTSLTLFRTVRWNENLICPSPIFAHQRRKGWFNRRGDQLWTNDGAYKPSAPGQEYPPDLDGYPEHGEGWMNEQGVRIDMAHRLIPKVPLKSALKTSRPQPATTIQLDS
ncbi:hypothetical protein C0995_004400 [Termitomyces sp. Mi166|nr:hypothetical protein C0995_004400 [Termitomyces sp. Mi166\